MPLFVSVRKFPNIYIYKLNSTIRNENYTKTIKKKEQTFLYMYYICILKQLHVRQILKLLHAHYFFYLPVLMKIHVLKMLFVFRVPQRDSFARSNQHCWHPLQSAGTAVFPGKACQDRHKLSLTPISVSARLVSDRLKLTKYFPWQHLANYPTNVLDD